ncbi:MbtH domain protein [Actinosynnema mirum DSM 43827]|uniref:MbtH domain protein n=1 Tax=Actinosynnema mirum (strain ATCC 29888 / DSM 43827 / JCM 3225 / NBRC 14064 / NCIMB 13271 / NRRL B-12336 / IMRU 3971 / 101) TaxID=446462 RepID=C6WBY9_ACTMD|nr:MbtH domain protein [Actinosynnema mirum DSM 43827]
MTNPVDDTTDDRTFHVVVNDEEQYSIWPADQDLPAGWTAEGKSGSREECLAHVDEVWTDMRPLSLRRFMDEHQGGLTDEIVEDPYEGVPTLVERLSAGQHAVEVSLRPERTAAALGEAVERGFVFVKFTGTDGGTELGVELVPEDCALSGADFASATGEIRLSGVLELDFTPVTCTASIDLSTLAGHGTLAVRGA